MTDLVKRDFVGLFDDFRDELRNSLIDWHPTTLHPPFSWSTERPRLAYPRCDVYETDSHVVMEFAVAGVELENLDVSVKDGMIVVKGKGESIKEHRPSYSEIKRSSFTRTMTIDQRVKDVDPKVTLKNGILRIEWKIPEESKELKDRKLKIESD